MILGITGLMGAGKGTVVEYLVQHYGAVHISARSFLTKKLLEQNKDITRENLVTMADSWRETYGPAGLAKALIDEAQGAQLAVVESLRAVAEVEYLVEQKGILFAVVAKKRIRYERILARKGKIDAISYEEFLRQDARESSQADPTKGNILVCIEKAAHVFTNNTTKEDLHVQVDAVMKQLL